MRVSVFLLACAILCGCIGPDRQNIRRNILASGQQQSAFMNEWGPPTKTYLEIVPGQENGKPSGSFSVGPRGASGYFSSGPLANGYDVWFYQDKAATLFFSDRRLFMWHWGAEPMVRNPWNAAQPAQ